MRDTGTGVTGTLSGAERAGAARESWVRVPCNSCDGYLEGGEQGGVCAGCLRDWANWHRNEREASERWVRKMMGGVGQDG